MDPTISRNKCFIVSWMHKSIYNAKKIRIRIECVEDVVEEGGFVVQVVEVGVGRVEIGVGVYSSL